jgi:uncharacterized delta-60 repeat protein
MRPLHRSRNVSVSIALAAAFALIFALAFASPAVAAGEGDPSFDSDGIAMVGFEGDSGFGASAFDVAIDDDGKIILVGATEALISSPSDFAITRLNANGAPDTSFSTDGKATAHFDLHDGAYAVAIQPDDKIIVAGYMAEEGGQFSPTQLAIARFEPDGDLDTSFSGDGKLLLPDSPVRRPSDLLMQDDGFVVLGDAGQSFADVQSFALQRLDFDGDPDPDFGDEGGVTSTFSGRSATARAIDETADGDLVVAGSTENLSGTCCDSKIAAARYSSAGVPDTGFSGDGLVQTYVHPGTLDYEANGVGVHAVGDKVLVGGESLTVDGSFLTPYAAAARFEADGDLDPTFSGDGTTDSSAQGPGGEFSARGSALQPDGRLVLAGADLDLARFDTNGSLDPSFSGDGIARRPREESVFVNAIELQADGRIVVAGDISDPLTGEPSEFLAARFLVGPDVAPIDTEITQAKVNSRRRKATLSFQASNALGQVSFECKLGSAEFAPCSSPKTYRKLARKRHTFNVRASDAVDREDETPARKKFVIK